MCLSKDISGIFLLHCLLHFSDYRCPYQVCSDMRKWRDKGLKKISVSVNFSMSVFMRNDITEIIRKALTDNDLEPECLCIEITEMILMENITNTIKKLTELKALGVKIALDNFGIGYSTLNILSSLPLDILKETLIKSRLRLDAHSACIFPVIQHKNSLTYDSMPASFLYSLTKNLTAHHVRQT